MTRPQGNRSPGAYDETVPEPLSSPVLQFLEWIAYDERTYGETMEAWTTHCPRLTVWEDALRGHRSHGGFIERFVHAWLFWDAPPWVFQAGYVAFGAVVALTWWRWPPRRR